MRNKKLISMLMLSAGFVACTQEEIVENGFAGIENQKDLVEDVVLNLSFGEGVSTRAAYAGAWDAEKGEVYPYENFYLTPDYTSAGALDLSDNVTLKGDMIGYCLTNGVNAITNYPFYIAGYGSIDLVEGEGDDATVTKNVYAFANQTDGKNPLYVLNVDDDQTVMLVSSLVEGTKTVKDVIDGAAGASASETGVDAGDLDVTKGILRTNTGIMKGDYVAYFPYNENFVEPGGIKVKADAEMIALFEAGNISANTTQQKSLETVHEEDGVSYSFYDYMFAVSTGTTPVNGGKNGGEVKLNPRTNVWTFALSNILPADATEEQLTAAKQTIKRITVRPNTEDANVKPFLMDGYVPMTALTTIVGDAETAENLIGASFDKIEMEGQAEIVVDEEVAPAAETEEANDVYYVSIPFYTDVNYTGTYLVEVYNTNGEVLTIETKNTSALNLGKAYLTKINLAEHEFVKATRKIFTEEDFIEEVVSGGKLQLMKEIDVYTSFTVPADAPKIQILGNVPLAIRANATISADVEMLEGELTLGANATVTGKLKVNELAITSTNKVTGEIEANSIYASVANNFNQKITAAFVQLGGIGGSVFNLYNADIEKIQLVQDATLNVYSTSKEDGSIDTYVDATVLENRGTLNVNYLKVGTLNNYATTNVNGELSATTVNNEALWSSVDWQAATFNVTENATKINAATFNNSNKEKANILNWDSELDMNLNVNNNGEFNINVDCDIVSNITNNGTLNINSIVFAEEDGKAIDNYGTLNVVSGARLEMNGTLLNVKKASWVEVVGELNGSSYITREDGGDIVYSVTSSNKLDDALSGLFVYDLYTGLKISNVATWSGASATDKKIYLYDDITFKTANLALNGGLVICNDATVTIDQNLTTTEIVVNEGKKFTLAGGMNTTVSENVTINEGASMIITNTGTTKVLGKFTGTGSLELSRSTSTVQGKYDRTLNIKADTPVN